uniref:Replicase n=1 Tax=Agaricus bisporus virus 16 TaxID=1945746 RepID=A0A1Q1M951_9VIRU|nr:replicase [Agaricus bisporus virus 16]
MMTLGRQLHSVENANRALRNAAEAALRDVVTSEPFREYSSQDIGRRATVVPIRSFEFNVPATHVDNYYSPDFNDDPENILGPVLEGMIPVVTSQDPASLLAAFNKRCNFMQAPKNDEIADKEFKMAIDLIRSLPRQEHWSENDDDRERWLNKFDDTKRKRMVEAWSTMSDASRRDISSKQLMVKIETLLKREDDEWAPRAIYVGTDAHNALTGPAMMVAMERWCALLDTDNDGHRLGPVDFRYGYKRDDVYLCEHLTRDSKCRVTLEGDYSRNDREQRSRVAYIIDAALEVLGFDSEVRKWMLESSEEYEVFAPLCGLKAKLKHQLPTGTTCTTFRNSVFNSVMFATSMIQQGVTNARALVLGDDLLANSQEDIRLQEWINCVDRFKMVLKAFKPGLSGKATFLSRRLIMNGTTPCLVPKIGKALARFNVRASKNPSITDDEYMAGKALAHAYEFRHVPCCARMFIDRFKIHNANQGLEDKPLEHDSWFLKISGLTTPRQVLNAVLSCPITVSEEDFTDWIADTYEVGWDDMKDLMEQVILSTEYTVLETGIFDEIAIDF